MMLSIKQRQLNLKHYYLCYTDKIDGIEGNDTKQAYKTFQKITGLTIDGIYGEKTNVKLINVIKELQTKLNKYGHQLTVDGYIGDKTISAIKQFQKSKGLTVDGIAGKNTFDKLDSAVTIKWEQIKYFKPSEFTCNCGCNLNNIDLKLVKILDDIRENFKKPIIITSGCRCKKHNQKVGGVEGSRHTLGKAADFYVQGLSVNTLLNYTKQLVSKDIIRYTYTNNTNMNGVVHIDIE